MDTVEFRQQYVWKKKRKEKPYGQERTLEVNIIVLILALALYTLLMHYITSVLYREGL